MIDIRRNYGGSLRDFASNHLHIAVLTQGNVAHLGRDDSLPCIMHLRPSTSGARPSWHGGAVFPLAGGCPARPGTGTIVFQTPSARLVGLRVSWCGNPLRPPRFQPFFWHTAWSHCPIDLQGLIGGSIR